MKHIKDEFGLYAVEGLKWIQKYDGGCYCFIKFGYEKKNLSRPLTVVSCQNKYRDDSSDYNNSEFEVIRAEYPNRKCRDENYRKLIDQFEKSME
jgi:hypothetical protein